MSGRLGRRIVFTLLAVFVVPALLLGALEIGLRVAGVGESRSFARKERVAGREVYTRNPSFARLFFEPQIAREANPFSLPVEKPAGDVRVFVLGASAANGIPESAYGLARQLETLLRERHPDANVHVIDVAITATNSHVTRRIADACARMEPDLFVLYLGNNEVVGPYGPGTVFAPLQASRRLIDLDLWARGTRIGQLVERLGRRFRPADARRSWKGLEMFMSREVRADDPRMETVYRHFRENVGDIVRTAQRAGAPIVVSTVGVNLRDCAPFASEHRAGLGAEEERRFDAAVAAGDSLAAAGRAAEADAAWAEAAAIDSTWAALPFRTGRAALAEGDAETARVRLAEARDQDALRFRADARINAILRETAGGREGEGVWLVDAADSLAAASPDRLPGRDLFWEHVHLTFEGNAVLARAIAESAEFALQTAGKLGSPARDWPDSDEVAALLAYTDWDRVDVARTAYNMIDQAPFSGQLGHDADLAFLRAEADSIRPKLRDEAEAMAATYRAAMEHGRPHWLLRFRYAGFLLDALGDAKGAAAEWAEITHEYPSFPSAWNQLARAQARMKDLTGAEESLRESLRVDPWQATAWSNLGTAVLQQDSDDRDHRLRAIDAYEHAVALDDDSAFVHNLSRAKVLEARHLGMEGEETKARAMLREVLVRDPEYAPAKELLERVSSAG